MKKQLLVVVLMLVFVLVLVGCGGGGSKDSAPQENGNGVVEENGADDGNGVVDEGDDADHEGGLPGYWPLYPGATFVEQEDTAGQNFINVFIYESADDVGEIYNWYLDNLETVALFESVEVEYESEGFCKVNAVIYIEAWEKTISDQVQIDSRSSDNTRLRFIVTDLDNLPGT